MKKKGLLVVIVLLAVGLVFGGLYATRNLGKSSKTVSSEEALRKLHEEQQ